MVDRQRRRLAPALLGVVGAAAAVTGARADMAGLGGAPLGVPGGAAKLNAIGDIDAAMTIRAAGGSASVSLSARLGLLLTPLDFGAVGDGKADDTAALQAWLTAGGGFLPIPSGGFYKVTQTLVCPSGCNVEGAGVRALIRLVLPAGSPVVPLMVTARGAANVTLSNFALDHNAAALIDPLALNGNPINGVCLFFMASNGRVSDCFINNAWDNGFVIGDIDFKTGAGTSGLPLNVCVDNVQTMNCGCGTHTKFDPNEPGLIGGGVVVSSGSAVVVSNCVDLYSYSGFATDTGGGAQASFVNCTSCAAKADPNHPRNGSGNAFVHQSGQCRFVGCLALFPGAYGFWFTSGIDSGQAVGCQSKGAGFHGFYINSGKILLSSCHSQSSGQAAANTYDGFNVTATYLPITNVQIIGCVADDATNMQRWGYFENQQNASISGCMIVGGSFSGSAGSINTGSATGVVAPNILRLAGPNPTDAVAIQNDRKGDIYIVTAGGVVQAQFKHIDGTTGWPAIYGAQGRAYIEAVGSASDVDIALIPKGKGNIVIPVGSLVNAASDSAAEVAGVQQNGFYRNGSSLQIRVN